MAQRISDNQYYTAIANAIRAKNGSSETYKPSEMATAIASLPGESTNATDWLTANYTVGSSGWVVEDGVCKHSITNPDTTLTVTITGKDSSWQGITCTTDSSYITIGEGTVTYTGPMAWGWEINTTGTDESGDVSSNNVYTEFDNVTTATIWGYDPGGDRADSATFTLATASKIRFKSVNKVAYIEVYPSNTSSITLNSDYMSGFNVYEEDATLLTFDSATCNFPVPTGWTLESDDKVEVKFNFILTASESSTYVKNFTVKYRYFRSTT